MDRRTGPGRQRTITTKEYENLIGNSICLQEDNPEEDNSYMSPKEVEKYHRYKPYLLDLKTT